VLAVWAVAMTTRMWHENLAVALRALRQHSRTGCCATMLHGGQRLEMGRENPILVLFEKLGFKGFDDR